MRRYQRTAQFDEWVDGASEETVEEMIKTVKKRKNIYSLIWLAATIVTAVCWFGVSESPEFFILILMGIPMGLILFCRNNLVQLKTRGNKKPGAISTWIYLILGGVLMPILLVLIASKTSLGSKILGI